jgi:hypothetical protein
VSFAPEGKGKHQTYIAAHEPQLRIFDLGQQVLLRHFTIVQRVRVPHTLFIHQITLSTPLSFDGFGQLLGLALLLRSDTSHSTGM